MRSASALGGERNVIGPLYVAAREVLLDALDALGEQREALILASTPFMYIHTGAADLAVAEFTTDGDLVVNPEQLKTQPRLSEAMEPDSFQIRASARKLAARPNGLGSRPRFQSTCSCRRLWRARGGEPRVLAITVIAPDGGSEAWRVR